MEAEKNLELHIPNILGFEKVAMDFVASAAKNMGFSGQRIEDLKTAVSEIEGKDKPRGWGIFLIKNLMDEVKFESTPEGGNLVRMTVCPDCRCDRSAPTPLQSVTPRL